jgi:hypothetical protein
MRLLPDQFEEAFLGLARRPNQEPVEAYDWHWLVKLAHATDELQALQFMPILIVRPSPKDWYWRQVARKRLFAWNGAHGALVGVGALPGDNVVSVYSREKMASDLNLVTTLRGSERMASQKVNDKLATLSLEREIFQLDFGSITPYYLP